MQNIKDAQIVVNNKNLIQRANIYIKHNAEFKNINADFAYCVEDLGVTFEELTEVKQKIVKEELNRQIHNYY